MLVLVHCGKTQCARAIGCNGVDALLLVAVSVVGDPQRPQPAPVPAVWGEIKSKEELSQTSAAARQRLRVQSAE